jgi:hypothetical protein
MTQLGLPEPQNASPTTQVAFWANGNGFQMTRNACPVIGNAFSLAGHAN